MNKFECFFYVYHDIDATLVVMRQPGIEDVLAAIQQLDNKRLFSFHIACGELQITIALCSRKRYLVFFDNHAQKENRMYGVVVNPTQSVSDSKRKVTCIDSDGLRTLVSLNKTLFYYDVEKIIRYFWLFAELPPYVTLCTDPR